MLFIALSHGPRLFIDDFFLHAEFVGNMMLELAESLQVYSNTENLRSKSILNPSNDGDNMTHPVKTMVRSLEFACVTSDAAAWPPGAVWDWPPDSIIFI